jgi:hypothetical protein
MKRLAQHNNRGCLEIYLLDRAKGQFTGLGTTNKGNCNRRSRG